MGVAATEQIIDDLKRTVKTEKIKTEAELKARLADSIATLLGDDQLALPDPSVILVVGVNGVGKTTSIGKLAHRLKSDGRSVLLVAGDTARGGNRTINRVERTRQGAHRQARGGGGRGVVGF